MAVVSVFAAFVMVVIAAEVRIGFQFSFEIVSDGFDDIAGDPSDELDSRFRECLLRTAADTAAEKKIHLAFGEKSRECPVSGISGRDLLHPVEIIAEYGHNCHCHSH